MNYRACQSLPTLAEAGTWYRAVALPHSKDALSTKHTAESASRYNFGQGAVPQFEILYLAENAQVALFEVEALFGSPLKPGGLVANPTSIHWAILKVEVRLSSIVDLTDVLNAQIPLQTTAQELTGDWMGYSLRSASTRIKNPTGPAPTQQLGAALFKRARCEGFRTLSAKLPYHEVLSVFPQRLKKTSVIRYTFTNAAGKQCTFQIPKAPLK